MSDIVLKIPADYAVAFEYADYSGLDDDDAVLIKDMITSWGRIDPVAGMYFTFHTETYDDKADHPFNNYFGKCMLMRVHLINAENY